MLIEAIMSESAVVGSHYFSAGESVGLTCEQVLAAFGQGKLAKTPAVMAVIQEHQEALDAKKLREDKQRTADTSLAHSELIAAEARKDAEAQRLAQIVLASRPAVETSAEPEAEDRAISVSPSAPSSRRKRS